MINFDFIKFFLKMKIKLRKFITQFRYEYILTVDLNFYPFDVFNMVFVKSSYKQTKRFSYNFYSA